MGSSLVGSAEDSTVEDSVDDTTGVADRDTLASAVPTGVYEVSLGTAHLHALNEFFSVLGGGGVQGMPGRSKPRRWEWVR